ncbi:UDP-N-acetylmuramoyl-L-alanine--D-glutamate ligase [Acidithiobacillus sp. M4-SHS-6]|uniref:UDP-N-acetylmuramoyl-L-alanine--D-glutamate ligase n=1 Tax=Acidithiobacillus sp. M4-SHS-6 TaxID=3383024 RepID=UPI0039BE5613
MKLDQQKVFILGFGKTGQSLLRTTLRLGGQCQVADTRLLDNADALRQQYPAVPFHFGPLPENLLLDSDLLLLSPGIAPSLPALHKARQAGIPVMGDVELFGRLAQAPIMAITGSNGKSTVTTLVSEMAQAAGLRVGTGGNLGTPALELLPENGPEPEWYILELSSFQLDACSTFRPRVAGILNLSPDHLDWHGDYQQYGAAKCRIFQQMGQGDILVLNADDPFTASLPRQVGQAVEIRFFGLQDRSSDAYVDQEYLTLRHSGPLLPVAELRMRGGHNVENALAAALLAQAAQFPLTAVQQVLRTYPGLPHRLAWVAEYQGVQYYDDSKGTNLGATLKAMGGLPGPLVMILGGDAKGADLSPLQEACRKQRAAVVLGKDADEIARLLNGIVPVEHANDMRDAVQKAASRALPGDQVLLSPACASTDMFRDYQDRGQQFAAAVRALSGGTQ